jgi:EAL domain-containing protein (putative c-di-GMP-specific phosphodiesterase class I)/GGDEF domain-containing protein/CheY-like chemotaxis protein
VSKKIKIRAIQVLAWGETRFIGKLKNLLPQDRFTVSPFPASAEARKAGGEVNSSDRQDNGTVPGIIVVDVSLLKQEGLLHCKSLVNNPRFALIPVVAVVAENDFDTAELALAAGVRDFVMKPFYKRNLAQRLEFLFLSDQKPGLPGGGVAGVSGFSGVTLSLPNNGRDLLTGLPVAELFSHMAALKLRGALQSGRQAALLLINLDHFRRVKSILGKALSDELILRVVRTIESTVNQFLGSVTKGWLRRENLLLGQNGQDEFLILITGIKSSSDVEELARALLSSISRPDGTPDPKAYLTARICIALAPADGDDIDVLIKKVESLAHHESRQGRDSYRFYTSGMQNTVARRFEIEAELSQGLHQGDLKIHYQPEVNIRTGEISGVEALVRWQHPQLGMLAPEAFIAVAEDVGLIAEIGEWVLRQACMQCGEWHKMGFGTLPVSINISPYQFSRVNMCELVERALSEASLPPEYLILEVTESLIIEDIEKTLATMLDLKRMGVRLSLDDFGTGYSSLSYLHSMSVDFLKIDRAFVKELPDHAGGGAVTEAIARMAKALGLGITAEGVETREQLQCLRALGVDYYQGYYFSEPLPADEFTSLLGNGRWKLPAVGKFIK